MIIKNWLNGPWYDDAGVRREGRVPGKILPVNGAPHRHLIGIVDCVTGVGQGFTTRGIPLYVCHPLRAEYPPFLVAIKDRYTTPPIVRFNYEHWENKWPRGGITEVLGLAGEKTVERQALLESIHVSPSYTATLNTVTCDTNGYDASPWDRVINIDPDRCQDVDDILCWRKQGDVLEFAIGIADVASWIPAGSSLDKDAAVRGTTMYENGNPVDPMLPIAISNALASLRADGKSRPVVALVYRIASGVVVGDARWLQIHTPVHTCYTYDSVIGTEDAAIVRSCVSAIVSCDIGPDSHLWIEQLMITYNAAAARILVGRGILRAHSGIVAAEWNDLAARTGVAEIAFLGAASGRYTDKETRHDGLGLDIYAHASSPLRRYADLVNQRWLKHILFGGIAPTNPNIVALNERCSLIKRMERFLWFLTNIHLDAITTVEGYIVGVSDSGGRVYVPSLRRVLKGVAASASASLKPGDCVTCRIYCNRQACSLESRYVVQIQNKLHDP